MNPVISFAEQGRYSIAQAAEVAGINRSTMHRIVFGNPQRGKKPSGIVHWHMFKHEDKGFLLGKELNKYFNEELGRK